MKTETLWDRSVGETYPYNHIGNGRIMNYLTGKIHKGWSTDPWLGVWTFACNDPKSKAYIEDGYDRTVALDIWDKCQKNGGHTHYVKENHHTEGYYVSIRPIETTKVLTPLNINQLIKENKNIDYLGFWKNTDGVWEVEEVKWFQFFVEAQETPTEKPQRCFWSIKEQRNVCASCNNMIAYWPCRYNQHHN